MTAKSLCYEAGGTNGAARPAHGGASLSIWAERFRHEEPRTGMTSLISLKVRQVVAQNRLRRFVMPAEVQSMTKLGRPMPRGNAGFTLVELMVVIIIITILAAMAIANYIRMQEHAKTASCTSNQRNIHQAATIYASDRSIPDGPMDVEDLVAVRAVAATLCECPSSNNASRDDYTLVWRDDLPRQVICDIKADKHLWQPR